MTGDVLLARSSDNATLTNIQAGDYVNQLSIPTLPIQDLRGLASVDVSIGGATFRFATTHLTFPPVQLQQMRELIANTSAATLPLIVAGDFNANADDPGDPTFATYQAAIDAGFVDAWSAAHPGDPGFTCCQAQNLLNATSSLNQRIDLTLLRGGVSVDDVELIGDSDAERTMPSGLWPSDHAGLIATFDIPEGSIAVPEASTWIMTLFGFAALSGAAWRVRNRAVPRSNATDVGHPGATTERQPGPRPSVKARLVAALQISGGAKRGEVNRQPHALVQAARACIR
jgi:endonuclease/exonuclease/phosphatase family metal-dependent hydrolase